MRICVPAAALLTVVCESEIVDKASKFLKVASRVYLRAWATAESGELTTYHLAQRHPKASFFNQPQPLLLQIYRIASYFGIRNRSIFLPHLHLCRRIKPLPRHSNQDISTTSHPPHTSTMSKGGTATGADWEKYQKKFAVSSTITAA